MNISGISLQTLFNVLPIDIVLWVLFGLVLVVFGIFSAVLLWHWKLYSTGKYTTVSNMILYLTVSAVFLFFMIISVLSYSFL